MKTLRLVLLLLLAVLLPVRGALAVAMACPPTAGGESGLMVMAAQQEQAGAMAQMDACHDAADDAAAGTPTHDGVCHLCAALCALTPMTTDVASGVESPVAVDAVFPRLHEAASRFEPDGLERPPRSC